MKDALQHLFDAIKPYVRVEGADQAVVAHSTTTRLNSLEEFNQQPNRIRQVARLTSSASFCAYINRFKNPETSVYIDVAKGKFAAVIDHHAPEAPQWGSHEAVFTPQKSLEWQSWAALHEKWLSQFDFAQTLEMLLDTIYRPEPNIVLQAALRFQANDNMTLVSAKNLDTGAVNYHFQKENAHEDVSFPHRITLFMPIYDNENVAEYEARIRFRNTDGQLSFKFSFVQAPAKIERDALLAIAEETRAATEGLAHYEGGLVK